MSTDHAHACIGQIVLSWDKRHNRAVVSRQEIFAARHDLPSDIVCQPDKSCRC